MRVTLTAAVLGLGAVLGLAPAIAQSFDPEAEAAGFSVAVIMESARAVGFQAEQLTSDDGEAAVKITTPNGPFIAVPMVCDVGPQCMGLDMFAFFGSAANGPLVVLNEFNASQPFVRAFTADGEIILSRYEIADYGIPKGNIASNFANFKAAADGFAEYLGSASMGVSFTLPESDERIETLARDAANAMAEKSNGRLSPREMPRFTITESLRWKAKE